MFDVPQTDRVDDPTQRRAQMFRRAPAAPGPMRGQNGRPQTRFQRMRMLLSGMRPKPAGTGGVVTPTDAGVIDRQPAQIDPGKFSPEMAPMVAGSMTRPRPLAMDPNVRQEIISGSGGGINPHGIGGGPQPAGEQLQQFNDRLPRSGPVGDGINDRIASAIGGIKMPPQGGPDVESAVENAAERGVEEPTDRYRRRDMEQPLY